MLKSLILAGFALAAAGAAANAEDFSKYSEDALRAMLAAEADVEKKVLVPMRDGVGLSTDIYRPKGAEGPLPTVFWRTPYNYNELSGGRLRFAAESVNRGYAFVVQNERGRYFSEGEFEILGYPRTDGYDALDWIEDQDWSNGKVGTLGCSSSAEWQLALAAQDHPAHAAMIPMASGAGIGRVGEFQEQGNWYTGGVPRSLFFVWLYNVDNPLRAQLPSGLDPATRARIGEYNDLAASKPEVDWKSRISHLPVSDMLSGLGEPPATFDAFIQRKPDDQGWFEGGLYHDNEGWGVPALWFNSWYDVSIGPNMALFNHVRENASDAEARDNQYAVIAPTPHCQFFDLGPDTVVGARNVGDTSFDTTEEIFAWFGKWLKGDKAAFAADTPHVRYYTMGLNEWQSAEVWPPQEAEPVRLYLQSDEGANSLYGDGTLMREAPAGNGSDSFIYDPMIPVLTIGGGDCCNGGIVTPGAFDQRPVEAREDVLVYTSEPLTEPMQVTGFVDAVLAVSSDAPDTDFAVKLVDVAPDGTAWIIDDTIMRARYREGYDTEVMMQDGEIYTLDLTPMTTSVEFQPGHRIRVEVTSSNFPKFVRNLNTGGDNYNESEGARAANTVHHGAEHASWIELPVVQ
ncbi:CocE/NonD family hydrolase [Euryhalocaulis caribicus]|uniref:CocE/NonD family hydrolase n=1 Tax=Euryhalocaulis caribicus TaxID=1161401 RepID=UPI00039B4F8A|nr:CocE/NonD family hydrolase [Euryhalocaulis caribicus]